MKPFFSVIVPIYKVEKFLKKCIDSILLQTYSNFELILVDDGSPDNCPLICDEYAKMDSRVRVIHKKNGGLVSARNCGLKASNGNYICYVDGDDWIKPSLLEVVFEKINTNEDVDMVIFGAIKQFHEHQEYISSGVIEGLFDKERLAKEVYPYIMYDNRKPFCKGLIFPVAWNKIYKQDLLIQHYCKDERIRMGEDNAFVFECLYSAEKVYFCDEYLYIYNQLNQESMVHSYDPSRFDNNKILTDYMQKRLEKIEENIDTQLNAFKAYWLIMAVFHEIKTKRPFFKARSHIKNKILETGVLESIEDRLLPLSARMYLTLLRLRLFGLALLGARVISWTRRD